MEGRHDTTATSAYIEIGVPLGTLPNRAHHGKAYPMGRLPLSWDRPQTTLTDRQGRCRGCDPSSYPLSSATTKVYEHELLSLTLLLYIFSHLWSYCDVLIGHLMRNKIASSFKPFPLGSL